MKRILFVFLLVFMMIGLVSAQNHNYPRYPNPHNLPRLNTERQTVTGELTIVQGSLAIKSGNTTYLAMGLNRYIGFIDSLKDGARVTLEGITMDHPRSSDTKLLVVSKLTVGGKDYDLERPWMTAPENRPERPQADPPARPQDRQHERPFNRQPEHNRPYRPFHDSRRPFI